MVMPKNSICILLLLLLLSPIFVLAQTPITSITTSNNSGTSTSFTTIAAADAMNSISAGINYLVNNGTGSNQQLNSLIIGSTNYNNRILPDTLIIRRTDGGQFVNYWYTLDQIDNSGSPVGLRLDADQISDVEDIYQTLNVNTGFDDLLVNTDNLGGSPPPQTERIDVIWYNGLTSSSTPNTVFSVFDRGGDDEIRLAAILSLDTNGDPATYSSSMAISNSDWPQTGVSYDDFLVLRRNTIGNDPVPVRNIGLLASQSAQVVQGVAVSFQTLGISTGQTIYGYSLFASDTNEANSSIDLTDISTFPTNTTAANSGLDLVAGASAVFSVEEEDIIEAVGPGGYQESLRTWLKADDGALTMSGGAVPTNGGSVTFWEDQSIGSHDFITFGTAPVYNNSSKSINGNPSIDFVENSSRGLTVSVNPDYLNQSTNSGYEKKIVSLVFHTNSNDITTRQQLFEIGGDESGFSTYIDNGNIYAAVWQTLAVTSGSPWNTSSPTTFISKAITTDATYILTLEFDGNINGTGDVRAYLNGEQFGAFSDVGLLFNNTDGAAMGNLSSTSQYHDGSTVSGSFMGTISEFIYYNEPTAITTAARQNRESYLAIKYGVALDQSIAKNYFNSEGTIVFDATNAASFNGFLEYNNDIAGIARDDESELSQLASQSENENSRLKIERTGAFSSDNSWLVWGNDAGALTLQNTDVPSGIAERITRVWRVSETGETGSVNITLDISGLGLSSDPDDFSLLIAPVNSAANFATNVRIIRDAVLNASMLTFSGVNLSAGEYIAFSPTPSTIGPGGVTTDLTFWLKADKGTSSTVDGSEITEWSDQSGTFSANGVLGSAPVYVENGVNFNPSLSFNGIDELLSASGGLNTTAYFIVLKPRTTFSSTVTAQTPLGFEVGSTAASIDVGGLVLGDLFNGVDETVNHLVGVGSTLYSSNQTSLTASIKKDEPYIFSVRTDMNGVNSEITQNGKVISNATFGSLLEAINESYTLGRFGVNTQGFENWFDGEIMEIMSFSSRLSELEIQRIESYLALKYGITLDQTAPTNYLDSFDNIVWDANTSASFNNNIAGIILNVDSGLEQKQSKSQNESGILTIGLGSISATNLTNTSTFSNEQAFWVWGNNGLSTEKVDANTLDVPVNVTERMSRVWQLDTSEQPEPLSFSFDLTALGYTLAADNYKLIISSSATMASGLTHSGGTINGNEIVFSGITVPVGVSYFSLGTEGLNAAPGGVSNQLELWLKANGGTNTTVESAPVLNWQDRSTKNRDAVLVDLGGANPVNPTFEVNEFNYNPGVRFYDTNSTNSSYLRTTNGNDVDGDFINFVVYKSNQTDGIANSMIDSPALLGSDVAGDLDYGVGLQDGKPYLNASDNNLFNVQTSNRYIDNVPHILSSLRVIRNNIDAAAIVMDSEFTAFANINNPLLSSPTSFGIANHNSPTANAQFDGLIAETMVYSGSLNFDERNRVESYLAIKYGITRTNINEPSTATLDELDYRMSNGSVIWDYDVQSATYDNDIAGIGVDSGSALLQPKSKSNNSDARITMSAGSFSNDNSFLIWGNDNAALTGNNSEFNSAQVKSRLNREWKVQETGVVGLVSVEVDLDGLLGPAVLNTSDLTHVVLMVDVDGDFTSGVDIITPSSITGNTLVFSHDFEVNSGFNFTIGSTQLSALPVTIVQFSAEVVENESILISWTTASESENAYFVIQRSIDGARFEDVGFIEGAKNSEDIKDYDFMDTNSYQGLSYYRLKQVDLNGTEDFSELISVYLETERERLIIYPNPVKATDLYFTIPVSRRKAVQSVRIFDSQGRMVKRIDTPDFVGESLHVTIEGLFIGLYAVAVEMEDEIFRLKLLVQ